MQLKEKIPNFAAFLIAIDESTDITDVAQLSVRGVTDEFEIIEDLLKVMSIKKSVQKTYLEILQP